MGAAEDHADKVFERVWELIVSTEITTTYNFLNSMNAFLAFSRANLIFAARN